MRKVVILCNIHGMTEFKNWVSEVTSQASTREIGRRINMNHVTVSRHINSSSVQFCIDLANAYDVNPVPGLIAAEAITEQQISEYSRSLSIDQFTDLELAQEIVNRLQDANDHEALTTPTDELQQRRIRRDGNDEYIPFLAAEEHTDDWETVSFADPKSHRTTPGVADDGYREGMPDDAVAYGHDEVGGTPDDFEP